VRAKERAASPRRRRNPTAFGVVGGAMAFGVEGVEGRECAFLETASERDQ
jgi:hypothetical protein